MNRKRTCIVSAVRALGLEERIANATPARVEKLLNHIGSPFYDPRGKMAAYEAQRVVTGSVVLGVLPIDTVQIGLVFHSLLHWVHVMGAVLPHGLFLQGAVTLGDVFLSRDSSGSVVGPGIDAALRMEKELARYPRIIVDPMLLVQVAEEPLLRKDTHSVLEELAYVRRLVREDADGLWFVDYLGAMAGEVDSDAEYHSFLLEHRSQINQRLAATKSLGSQSLAWTWLACYHDALLDSPPEGVPLDESLRKGLRTRASESLRYRFPAQMPSV